MLEAFCGLFILAAIFGIWLGIRTGNSIKKWFKDVAK